MNGYQMDILGMMRIKNSLLQWMAQMMEAIMEAEEVEETILLPLQIQTQRTSSMMTFS